MPLRTPLSNRYPQRDARPARLSRVAVGAALGVWSLLYASSAHATTISVSPAYPGDPPSLPRIGADGKVVQKRALNLQPEGVSLQDCIDDQRIRFPLALDGFAANASLQAWASTGADCTQQTNRQSTNQLCWPLAGVPFTNPDGTIPIPLALNPNVDIPVRRIMAGALVPATPDGTENICGKVDLSTISVTFMYFDPGQLATPSATKAFTIQADTIGPPPPTGLSAKPGNTRIAVSWDSIGEGGVIALTGVKVYCDPSSTTTTPPTTELICDAATADADAADADADADAEVTDAGSTVTDAGCVEVTSEAGTTQTTCSSPNFVSADGSDILPDNDFNSKFECGSVVGNTGSSVIADSVRGAPLTNGTTYAVAVAATDAFGNVGPLSSVVCEFPEQTNDFWENYKAAGGAAGGGYCSVDAVGVPMGSASLLGTVGVFALSMIRRRARRSRRENA